MIEPATLQTIFGTVLALLSAVSLALASWALKSIVQVARDQRASDVLAKERKENVAEKFIELRQEIDRTAINLRQENAVNLGAISKDLTRIEAGVEAVHRRLDVSGVSKG